MRRRIRLLSIKGGVGKSVLSLLIANYLKEVEIPFIVEELDPIETIRVLSSNTLPIIIYFSTNDFLYKRLKVNENKLRKQLEKYHWLISISDMFTGIDPNSDIVQFQDSVTSVNLNVFLTDKSTVSYTVEYAIKWKSPRILIINFADDPKKIEEEFIDYVYGEGIFHKVYGIPFYGSFSELENSPIIRKIIKDLLDILIQI
ncbi:hypothetical protein EWF20_10735 [Sulfolobus sp. S-194]|uniref:hypothetical protein n=1 Tax=Sulfolobus sp. S-194 TaxID=2512240 RepID=UPI001436EC46|nr:hypothetical protein [Sulfolobus sp. S-194]QIW24559.1 hypothetical protein EWF20_10735 [Sulfolobus sp. S-194]